MKLNIEVKKRKQFLNKDRFKSKYTDLVTPKIDAWEWMIFPLIIHLLGPSAFFNPKI